MLGIAKFSKFDKIHASANFEAIAISVIEDQYLP